METSIFKAFVLHNNCLRYQIAVNLSGYFPEHAKVVFEQMLHKDTNKHYFHRLLGFSCDCPKLMYEIVPKDVHG